jgi:hypothetical protein
MLSEFARGAGLGADLGVKFSSNPLKAPVFLPAHVFWEPGLLFRVPEPDPKAWLRPTEFQVLTRSWLPLPKLPDDGEGVRIFGVLSEFARGAGLGADLGVESSSNPLKAPVFLPAHVFWEPGLLFCVLKPTPGFNDSCKFFMLAWNPKGSSFACRLYEAAATITDAQYVAIAFL